MDREEEEWEEGDFTEEDGIEESSDKDEDEEEMIGDGDLRSLKGINAEYSKHLKKVLVKLQQELARNQRRQREIEEEISSQETEEEGGPQQHRVRRLLGTFAAPYFKDQNDFQPPANIDTITKRCS